MVLNIPLGQTNDNPSPDDILELLDQDDSYWNDGSGSASLSVDSVEKSNEILMFYRESKYGYVILQMDDHKAFMNEAKDKNHIIVHNIGGEPFPVPLCFFVNRSQAEEILLRYLQNAVITDYNLWQPIYNDFDFESYLESDEYVNGDKEFMV